MNIFSKNDRMILIAKCISGFNFLETNSCTNITCFNKIDRILFVGKHFHDPADTFILSATHILYIGTRIQVTAITPEERQTSNKWIGHDLKCKRSKWFFSIRLTRNFFAGIRISTYDASTSTGEGR